jgi:hypothetical protein
MARNTLSPDVRSMGRSRNIGVAVNARNELMRGCFDGFWWHLQGYRLAADYPETIRFCVTLIAKGLRAHHPFVGIDIRLAMAIQANQFTGLL